MTLLVFALLLAQAPASLKHPILPTWPYMGLHTGGVPWGGIFILALKLKFFKLKLKFYFDIP
jgi:hypothetical protein